MIIQKRICDKCKKEIEEREERYFKANISVVNATSNGTDNSVNGDYCTQCFTDICETIINIEEEKKEEVVEPEVKDEPLEEEKTEEEL
jgi:hypothetical protein